MKKRLTAIIFVLFAALALLPPSAQAQEQFSQGDLSGDWVVFLYGAYDTKTEHMYGICRVNEMGMIVSGTNTYRGELNQFRGGQLTISPEGVVAGNIIIEAWRVELKFLWSRMNMTKSEVTGMVKGQWYAGLIRMVKANEAVANDG